MLKAKEISTKQKKYYMQCWGKQNEYNPIAVDRTKGCYIYTTDGRKIFDLRSAHECINLGFNNTEITDEIRKQLDNVIYVTDDFATEPTASLSEKLSHMTPGKGNKKVWFGQSGAASVEAALKISKFYKYSQINSNADNTFYSYPNKIISRYRSWHGSTNGAASVSGDPRRWFNEPSTQPSLFAPEANCFRCPLNHRFPECNLACAEYFEYMIEMEGGKDKVAAIILEPIVGSNGIILPPDGYFKRVREICDKWNIVLIIDETMSGVGRTGKMFAIEHYDIVPDIIIMGKALGVNVPLSAVIMQSHIAEVFDENIFGHGQSYSGHTLGCASALASINYIEKYNVLGETTKKGIYLKKKLVDLKEKHPSIGEVRGIGLFWKIEIIKNIKTKEPVKMATEKYKRTIVSSIADYLLNEKMIYIPSDKFGIWIVPPLIVTYKELDYIVDSIDEALLIADEQL